MSASNLVISLLWRLLPKVLRDEIAVRRQAGERRAEIEIPRSTVWVYAWSEEHRRRFTKSLVPDFIAEFFARNAGDAPHSALITTCYNEASSTHGWFAALEAQSILPSEIVIVDGGSTDGTIESLTALCSSFNERHRGSSIASLVSPGRCSIAAGRNIGARDSTAPILLFTDFGCELDPHWCERMTVPFRHRPDTEVVCGWYEVEATTPLQQAVAGLVSPQLDELDPALFLPSARSLALRREVFERVSGFPEYLSHAGEDSLLDFYLKHHSSVWAFVPDAIVRWNFPRTLPHIFKTIRNYARGDAEGGKLFWRHYLWAAQRAGVLGVELTIVVALLCLWYLRDHPALLLLVAASLCSFVVTLRRTLAPFMPRCRALGQPMWRAVIASLLLLLAQVTGFLRGVASRREVERRRRARPRGEVVVLTESPLETPAIFSWVNAGWFVTNVAEKHAGSLEHPFVDHYCVQEFLVDEWLSARVAKGATPSYVLLDHSPALAGLAARFASAGASPIAAHRKEVHNEANEAAPDVSL